MPMRSFPFMWLKQEQMWTQVHWLDGTHEYLEGGLRPRMPTPKDLWNGRLVTSDPRTHQDVTFEATAVTGHDCDRLWAQLEQA